jgi:hypothetical protein
MMSFMNDEDLIPTSELAGILGIERSTIAKRVKAGTMTPDWVAPGYRGGLYWSRRSTYQSHAQPWWAHPVFLLPMLVSSGLLIMVVVLRMMGYGS